MKKVDYWWIFPVLALVLVAIFWKPIFGAFSGGSAKLFNKEGIEHGQQMFHATTQWAGPEFQRSCAMCHDPGYKPAAGMNIEMIDYTPGEPVILEDLASKYRGGVLADDLLAEQVNRCITLSTRINGMKQDEVKDEDFVDLLAYLNTL